jgi:pyruvate kinase
MANIAHEIEASTPPIRETPLHIVNNEISAFLARSAVRASLELNTKAIVADTSKGRTVRALAAYRGRNIIFAQCYDEKVGRQLALSYGVYANFSQMRDTTYEFLNDALEVLLKKYKLKKSDLVVVIAGNFGPSIGPSFIEVSTMENLMKMYQRNALISGYKQE